MKFLWNAKMEVSPVDPQIVPGLCEDFLVRGTCAHQIQFRMLIAAPYDLVGRSIDGNCAVCVEIDLQFMRFSIHGFRVETDIGYRTRKNLETMRKCRSQKG